VVTYRALSLNFVLIVVNKPQNGIITKGTLRNLNLPFRQFAFLAMRIGDINEVKAKAIKSKVNEMVDGKMDGRLTSLLTEGNITLPTE
jgi:hypothetical protein